MLPFGCPIYLKFGNNLGISFELFVKSVVVVCIPCALALDDEHEMRRIGGYYKTTYVDDGMEYTAELN